MPFVKASPLNLYVLIGKIQFFRRIAQTKKSIINHFFEKSSLFVTVSVKQMTGKAKNVGFSFRPWNIFDFSQLAFVSLKISFFVANFSSLFFNESYDLIE